MARIGKKAPSVQAQLLVRVEQFFDKIAPDLIKRLDSAERRAAYAERELERLQLRLRSLLTSDQVEAAHICGVTPEFYCIELIELWKERIWQECPVEIYGPRRGLRG
jgi:hypothetical protein